MQPGQTGEKSKGVGYVLNMFRELTRLQDDEERFGKCKMTEERKRAKHRGELETGGYRSEQQTKSVGESVVHFPRRSLVWGMCVLLHFGGCCPGLVRKSGSRITMWENF